MQSGIGYSNPANRAVKAFKSPLKGLPRIYLPFIPLALAIAPIWLAIPFMIWAIDRLARLGIKSARICARLCMRACAYARASVSARARV